ncbi:energy transducer TonB [Pseudomonas sp.]|uniref:energy transducer TonB n=1 Tax=Pseudomonas sp. TaxID=306 RepID=UPI003C7730DD
MLRLPLYLLLSVALHIGVGLLLRDIQAEAGVQLDAPAVMAVQMIDLSSPPAPSAPRLSAAPPAVSKPEVAPAAKPKPPVAQLPARKPSLPVAQIKTAHAESRPRQAAKPAAAPAPQSALPSMASVSRSAAQAQSAPARVTPREVFSQQPSFVSPPPAPRYPSQARRRNQQGVVLVEVRLDELGRQRELKLLRSSGVASLDSAALEAVSGWRFRPEMLDGQSVPSRVQIPIQFALTASR